MGPSDVLRELGDIEDALSAAVRWEFLHQQIVERPE
jgi:hypothetical protein